MAILELLIYPDKRLALSAAKIATFDETIGKLARDLADTMYAHKGVGLAATQVNIQRQIFVMDVSESRDQLQVFVNPVIIEQVGLVNDMEGCLSVPEVYESVDRAETVTLRYQDVNGAEHTVTLHHLAARCASHEIDHLHGIVFVSHLSRLKQTRIRHKLSKHYPQDSDSSRPARGARADE